MNIKKLLVFTSIFACTILSCNKDPEVIKGSQEPNPPTPPTPPVQIDVPSKIEEINPDDYNFLLDLAKKNNFEDDIKNTNPNNWNNQNIAIVWKKENNIFFISQLNSNDKKNSEAITQLDLSTFSEKLKYLEKINLTLPKISLLNLSNIKSLKEIIISGAGSSSLTKINLAELPALTTLKIKDFPKLESSNTDDIFKINYYYQYDNLKNIAINNTAIKGLDIDTTEKISELSFEQNKSLDYLVINNAPIPQNFSADNFPALKTITIKKGISNSDIKILNLNELTNINISKVDGIKNITLQNCPKATELNLNNLGIASLSISNTPELRTIDLAGNNLKKIDLSPQNKLKNINLSDNEFENWDDIKLPQNIEKLTFTGNEKIESVDLSKFEKLYLVNVNGYKKGETQANTQKPNALKYINITGLKSLERILAKNNSLSQIITSDDPKVYESLSNIDLNSNNLSPNSILSLHNILNNIDFSSDSKGIDYKLQRPFKFEKVEKNIAYLTTNSKIDLTKFNIDVTIESLKPSDYQFDKSSGTITVNKKGSFVVTIKIKELEQVVFKSEPTNFNL